MSFPWAIICESAVINGTYTQNDFSTSGWPRDQVDGLRTYGMAVVWDVMPSGGHRVSSVTS